MTMGNAWALGVDIGGTKTLATLVDNSGVAAGVCEGPTPAAGGPDAVLDGAIDLARRALNALPGGAEAVAAIGVGAAGVIDAATGTVLSATSSLPGWSGTDIRRAFQDAFPGLDVVVVNDVQAFTWAETVHGSAFGRSIVLGVMVGTGIGGGLVVGGRLVDGAHSAAGHLGHVTVASAAGLRCPCGRSGHLEAVASGPAMTDAYRRAGGDARDLRAVAAAATSGDPIARVILDAGADAVGIAIGSVANMIDPDTVVIGGGVTGLGDGWLDRVRVAAAGTAVPALGLLQIDVGTLGATAVAIGAAELARAESAGTKFAAMASGPVNGSR